MRNKLNKNINFFEGFKININDILIKHLGFTEKEVSSNPNIFVRSVKDLENQLKELKNSCGDIEVVLKQNPMII